MIDSVKNKLLHTLDVWAAHFMTIGVPSETPRFSQVDIFNDDFKEFQIPSGLEEYDKVIKLYSTVTPVHYWVGLTNEEFDAIKKLYKTEDLWDWWKGIRTEHILDNYKTIIP